MRDIWKPVDLLSLVFIALLAVVTLAASSRIPHWGWTLSRLALLAAALPTVAWYASRPETRPRAAYLRAFVPIAVILVAFDSLGDIIPWLWPRYADDLLIKIDHALFGVHPTVWFERFIHPLLTSLLQAAYISYYPMSVTLGILLLAKRREAEFDTAFFGIALCFYLSYLGYLLVPAVGPRFTLQDIQTSGLQAGEFTLAVQHLLNTLEHNKTDAFPSGHTAVAITTLYYAWKFRERIYAAFLAPTVLALMVSTVYLRYHYVIDVLAGIVLALVTIVIAPRAYNAFGGSHRHSDK